MAGTAPLLLLSMPQMADPNFAQTVILLCEYTDEGAFGLVVNRQMHQPAWTMVRTEPPIEVDRGVRLWAGGPVDPHRTWVLMTDAQGPDEEQREICPGVVLSVSDALTLQLLQGPPSPRARVIVGYAGWGPGQLDQEIAVIVLADDGRGPVVSSSACLPTRCGRRRSAVSGGTRQRCKRAPECTDGMCRGRSLAAATAVAAISMGCTRQPEQASVQQTSVDSRNAAPRGHGTALRARGPQRRCRRAPGLRAPGARQDDRGGQGDGRALSPPGMGGERVDAARPGARYHAGSDARVCGTS